MPFFALGGLLLVTYAFAQEAVIEGRVPDPVCGQKALPFKVIKGRAVSNEKATDTDFRKRWAWKYEGEGKEVIGDYWCPTPNWVIRAPTPALGHQFGAKVAWGDDTLFAVAANGVPNEGRVHIFRFYDEQWNLEHTVNRAGRFGAAVALWPDLLAVSAPNLGSRARGQVYLYAYTAAKVWEPMRGVVESKSPQDFENFGSSMQRDRDWLVIGADGDPTLTTTEIDATDRNLLAPGSGGAFLFKRETPTATTLVQRAYFKSRSVTAGDRCGASVAVRYPIVVMGCPSKLKDVSWAVTPFEAGMVYVYHQSSSTSPWKIVDELWLKGATEYQRFGEHLALGDTALAITAPGDRSCYNGMDGGPNHQATKYPSSNCYNSSAVFYIVKSDTNPPRFSVEPRYLKPLHTGRKTEFGVGPLMLFSPPGTPPGTLERLVMGMPRDSHDGTGPDAPFPRPPPTNAAAAVQPGQGFRNESGAIWTLTPSLTEAFRSFRFHKSAASAFGGLFGSSIAVSPNGEMVLVGAKGEGGRHSGPLTLSDKYPAFTHGQLAAESDDSGTVYLYVRSDYL